MDHPIKTVNQNSKEFDFREPIEYRWCYYLARNFCSKRSVCYLCPLNDYSAPIEELSLRFNQNKHLLK